MKPYILLICLVALLAPKASAQTDTNSRQKITNVVLSAPPNAHYFGEGYRIVSLTEIHNKSTDTVNITETIRGYLLMDRVALIYFGGVYPNQKLTVVLKGQAKQYLDAILKVEYEGSDTLHVLYGRKFISIGKITLFKGKPRIVITSPNLFAIITD